MKNKQKNFIYKNKIILTNGSSLKIVSIKFFKNYQLNSKFFKKIESNNNLIILNQEKSNFLNKIKNY